MQLKAQNLLSPPKASPMVKAAADSPIPLSVMRLWRPAAQRNIRNQWSKLASLSQQWFSSSSSARSLATSVVNSHLSHQYMDSMKLGALSDMPGIREKACLKLLMQQEACQGELLSSYKEMVSQVVQMVNASRSLRCYIKGTSDSLVKFSCLPENQDDNGDGGGCPIFTFLSISCFEKFADEFVQMFKLELNLKRLLIMEFLSLPCKNHLQNHRLDWSDEFYDGEFDDLNKCNIYSKEACAPVPPSLESSTTEYPKMPPNNQPDRRVLQVYLTTWLAEVNIDKCRGLSQNSWPGAGMSPAMRAVKV